MAYNTATLLQIDPPSADDRVRLVIRFTGNAGELAKNLEFYVTGSTAPIDIRRWCIDQAAKLDGRKNVADNLTIGQTINLAAIAPVAPTAKQIWREKVVRARSFSDVALTGSALAALNALVLDINNTYAAGHLD